jgi:hypothetical protein
LDLRVLPACTAESCSLKEIILDDCLYLQDITGLPKNLDLFSAKSCTALNSQSISMLLKQVLSLPYFILFNICIDFAGV